MKPTTRFRQRLAQPGLIVAPGAYDGLSAKLIEQAGFDVVYATGGGISRSCGYPDIGLLTMTDVLGYKLAIFASDVQRTAIYGMAKGSTCCKARARRQGSRRRSTFPNAMPSSASPRSSAWRSASCSSKAWRAEPCRREGRVPPAARLGLASLHKESDDD